MSSKLFKNYRNGSVGRSFCSLWFWVLFAQCCEAALVAGCWVAAGQHHSVRLGVGLREVLAFFAYFRLKDASSCIFREKQMQLIAITVWNNDF